MADPLQTADDTAPGFLQRREQSAGEAAWERLNRLYPPGESEQQDLMMRAGEPAPDASATGGATIGKVVKDVARGVTEAPGQVIRGATSAAQETVDMFISAGDWLERKFPITPGYDPANPPEITIPQMAGEAESTTGKMFKDVSQFLVGFAGAGKLKVFKALQPTSRAGKVSKAAGQGAVADFTVMDPYEDKLADVIQKYPTLANPVSAFLASGPEDGEATRRFKRALEGAGLGVLADGMVAGVSALRAARKARAEARVADPENVPAMKVRPEELRVLGDPEGQIVQKMDKAVEAAKGAKPGAAAGEPEVFINFARINEPDDIKQLVQLAADAQAGDIKAAARGVRTWEKTKLSAQQQNAWSDLMTRRTGEPLNAEQSFAARQLWATSGEKLSQVAQMAAEVPTDANLAMFRKMLSVHYAVQKEVIAARTETARALNAWKIPAGGDAMLARNLENMIAQSGGLQVNRALAERVAALAKSGDSRALEKMVEGSVFARTREAVAQVWINALLSNPATHAVNAVSNWTVIGQQMIERRVAAQISDALGTEGGVAAGEAMAQLGAVSAGFREAMRAAWKTFKSGEAQFGLTKLDTSNVGGPGALSAEAWRIANETPLGRALDMVDATTRVPGRMLATSDEFFKSIGYRMEVHAQATRVAQQEVASGTIQPDALKKRIAELIENPPENIKLEAVDAALYQTFTQKPAETLGKVADAWQNLPVLGVLTMPFKRTPINLLTYAAERSPMAPLVRSWREDIAAGGARADLATARIATGSTLMLAMIDAAMSGQITGKGPTRPEERQNWMRQGNQEYSIKVGNRWYSYGRLDPMGMTVGMAADIAESIVNADKKIEKDGDTYNAIEEALISSMFAVAKNATSKTYMQGLAQFFDAISNPDMHGERYFQRLAGSGVPAGVATAARQVDPYMRTAQTTVEAMQKRMPFWSKDLPMYRDLWGRPVDYRSGFGMTYDIFSPVYTKKYAPEPIDTELKRLEFFPSMPEKKITYNGVTLDLENYPKAYERYVALAGNELKLPQFNALGAKDFLNQVTTGKHPMAAVYKLLSDGRDGGKADQIKQWISVYRRYAKDQLIQEFGDLRAEYDAKRKPFGNKLDPALFGR